jgi:hypothetical protein
MRFPLTAAHYKARREATGGPLVLSSKLKIEDREESEDEPIRQNTGRDIVAMTLPRLLNPDRLFIV